MKGVAIVLLQGGETNRTIYSIKRRNKKTGKKQVCMYINYKDVNM